MNKLFKYTTIKKKTETVSYKCWTWEIATDWIDSHAGPTMRMM